jgi:glycosyltransferase involved in cell wall biosynthesis
VRLCFLTTEYPGVTDYSGGIGSQYGALAPALAAQGHDVTVLTGQPGGEARLERDGVAVHRLSLPRSTMLRVAALPRIVHRALAPHAAFDAVVAAEYGAMAARYARSSARAGPLVTHLHTSLEQIAELSDWSSARRLLPQVLVQRRLERAQARASRALLSPTHALLDWTRSLWGLERLPAEVVPNAIDLTRVLALADGPPPAGLPAEGPIVAFSGRLEARKGIHDLAAAMRRVWGELPAARLVLLGGDDAEGGVPMSRHVIDLVGTHADRVHYLGPQPPELLFPALRRATVVALPSVWEAFGIAALEAMALGCPTVLTSGHGYDEFARAGVDAEMVPPRDPDALGRAILALLRDERRRAELGAAAATRARDYDVRLVAGAFAASVQHVLGGDAQGPPPA